MYWPEEQAVSVVGSSAIVSLAAVTTGCDAQVRAGRANCPGIISAIGNYKSWKGRFRKSRSSASLLHESNFSCNVSVRSGPSSGKQQLEH